MPSGRVIVAFVWMAKPVGNTESHALILQGIACRRNGDQLRCLMFLGPAQPAT
jgi:hypothetical protein